MAYPISAPPTQQVTIPFGKLFFSKTSIIIFIVAIVINAELGPGFQTHMLPQIKARAIFHPNTALGKLNAVITPTIPSGFHYSIIKCYGLSDGITVPFIDLLNPQAKSQISMVS